MFTLKLKDIYLGSTDAKNEVLSPDPAEIDRFLKSYVTPPSLSVERFATREKYFIVGLKGTGKTALLRYVSLKLDTSQGALSRFILFKSEVDEDLRHDFLRAARVEVVEENSDSVRADDFEMIWRWFIYRKIAQVLDNHDQSAFQDNAVRRQFCTLVNSEYLPKKEKTGLMRLIPAIKKGSVEISKDPKLGLELTWDENGVARIQFNELVRKADQLFEELSPDTRNLNLFFDELELNYSSKKQFQRDSQLVRDLIVSIEKLNAIAKRRGFPLCLYAAVRSEVLISIDALGKEINKPMADFGAEILWNRPELSPEQQPLLYLIEQRINNSRVERGLPKLQSAALWHSYFPTTVLGQSPQLYILHSSWFRPRDVVRLLLAVQEQYPEEVSFTLPALEAVRKKYSTASWVEMTEELRVKYKASEINGIKYLFYGFPQVSSLTEIMQRVNTISDDRPELAELLAVHSAKAVLKDLYRVGVIGNISRTQADKKRRDRVRFSFRGDDEILFHQKIFVHNALKSYLSAT